MIVWWWNKQKINYQNLPVRLSFSAVFWVCFSCSINTSCMISQWIQNKYNIQLWYADEKHSVYSTFSVNWLMDGSMPHAYLPNWSPATHTRTLCLFWSPPAVSSRWSRFSRDCCPPGLPVSASRSPLPPKWGQAFAQCGGSTGETAAQPLSVSRACSFSWTAPSRLGPRCWFLRISLKAGKASARWV